MSTSTRLNAISSVTSPSLLRSPALLQVLVLAAVVASASTWAHAQESAPTQRTQSKMRRVEVVRPEPELASWPSDARVSLELRRAPLTTLLSALSAQSGVKFRLATIPDVEVSVSLQNAPLQQAVRDLLALKGFELRPGPDAFWLVAAPPLAITKNAQDSTSNAASRNPEGWRWWASTDAPPARWMVPTDDEQIAYDGVPSISGVPGLAPFGVRVRMQSSPLLLSRWKSGVQKFQDATPGVLPAPATTAAIAPKNNFLPGSNVANSTPAEVRWCARWPITLRSVPPRCLLVIESERPANLYVNGARLLHAWSGKRTLDVSGALNKGSNLLAIEWLHSADAASSTPRLSSAAPLVRYEWLVAQ